MNYKDRTASIKIFLAITIALIVIIGVYTWAIILREKMAIAPLPAEEAAPSGAAMPAGYRIPSNTIPILPEIAKNSEKAARGKKESKSIRAKFEEKRVEERSEPVKKAVSENGVYPPDRSNSVSRAGPPERKKAALPTMEDRKHMQERGILCY